MKSTNFLVIISKEIGGLIMENLKLPKIGLRTIKSGIAVFLCLALLPSEPFFACLTAVICLQDTVYNSIHKKDRERRSFHAEQLNRQLGMGYRPYPADGNGRRCRGTAC